MFFTRWRTLMSSVTEVRAALDKLDRRSDKMETILMIREPSSVVAADAYEGLRKQVVSAVSERLAHVSQLAQFDLALARNPDPQVLIKVVDDWLEQAGLMRIADPGHPEFEVLFELVANGGGAVEVLEPAYVDRITNRVVRVGRAQRVHLELSTTSDGPEAATIPAVRMEMPEQRTEEQA